MEYNHWLDIGQQSIKIMNITCSCKSSCSDDIRILTGPERKLFFWEVQCIILLLDRGEISCTNCPPNWSVREKEACSCWNDFIVFIQKPSCEAWEENSLTTNPISCPDPRVDTKQSISQLFNSDFHRSHIYICWTVFPQKNPPIIKKNSLLSLFDKKEFPFWGRFQV